jgi:hypothetical protein
MNRLPLVLLLMLAACASADTGATDAAPPPIDATALDACVPQAEICNLVDDDCDTSVDEDIADLGADCMVGEGACQAAGVYVCDDAGGVVCDATSGTPAGELCNGLDDDCDQGVDEGLGVGDPCDGADPDACTEGHIVCSGDSAICDDETADSPEQCNGADDDCRNGIDDLWPIGQTCSVGVGACAASGTWACDSLSSVACSATAGSATAEVCGDGVDQDCNGGDVTCPVNDLASGAVDISGGGTFTVDLAAAHDNFNDGTCGLASGGGRDVYYRFTLPAAEVVYADTFGSSFDTVLELYSGACTSVASQMACSDDSCGVIGPSQLAVQLAAGSYCLVVDQYTSAQTSGDAVLQFIRGGRTGTAIGSATSGTLTGNTVGGPNTQTATSCQSNASGPEAAWYWTRCPAEAARTVNAATCSGTSFDTIITLRTGAAETACADDQCGATTPVRQSTLPATTVNGAGLFWLVLDGWNGASGAYSMTYSN